METKIKCHNCGSDKGEILWLGNKPLCDECFPLEASKEVEEIENTAPPDDF